MITSISPSNNPQSTANGRTPPDRAPGAIVSTDPSNTARPNLRGNKPNMPVAQAAANDTAGKRAPSGKATKVSDKSVKAVATETDPGKASVKPRAPSPGKRALRPSKPAMTKDAPVQAKSPAKPLAAKTVKPVAKVAAKPPGDAAKVRKPKLVRDSFTMPEAEYAVLSQLKKYCLKAGFEIKKSELLRIGMVLIAQIELATLQDMLTALPQLKTGRPKNG